MHSHWWIAACLVATVSSSSPEDEHMDTFGEVFASWCVVIMLVLLIVALNYFERVRQPPVPILEKYTKNIQIPPRVAAKIEEITEKGRVAVYTWAIELPYVGKMIKGQSEMKPLKHDSSVNKDTRLVDDEVSKEDFRDMIIGAPLDEDGISSPGSRTSPKSPPLVVIKTMDN